MGAPEISIPMLGMGAALMVVGIFTLPVDLLPHTTRASVRVTLGALMLVFGGALLGRQLIA